MTKVLTEADRAAWSDLLYVFDPGSEVVVSIYADDGGSRRERDFTVLGSLEALNPMALSAFDFHELQLAVVES